MTSEVMAAVTGSLSRLLHAAPFRDEERGGLGRLPERSEIDIFVEAVYRRPAGAETKARDVVVQSVEPLVCECGQDEIRDLAAVHRPESPAEGRLGFGRILQLIAFRQEARPLHIGR